MNNRALMFLSEDDSNITLSKSQKEVIAQMKSSAEAGQLLAMLHGLAGSGKTTISRYFMRELNLKPVCTASTGFAAAQRHC